MIVKAIRKQISFEDFVFLGILLFITLPANMFANSDLIKSNFEGSNLSSIKILINIFIFVIYVFYIYKTNNNIYKIYKNPFLYLFLLILVINIYQAHDFYYVIKNTMLLVVNFIIFSLLFCFVGSKKNLVESFIILSLVVLCLSYLGVILYPAGTIHLASDGFDGVLENAWRGVFLHKNSAGAFCAFSLFISILAFNNNKKLLGGVIAALALVFMIMSKSKTPLAFVFAVIILTYVIVYSKHIYFNLIIFFVSLITIYSFTVGTLFFEFTKGILILLNFDYTFTGRNIIWEFCLQGIEAKPWFGHGMHGFWDQPHIKHGASWYEEWVNQMRSAHNGLYEIILEIGFVGLGLFVVFALVLPARDLIRIKKLESKIYIDKSVLLFFVQIWIMMLFVSSTESVFMNFNDIGWNLFVFSIFSLRFMSKRYVLK